MNEDHTLHMMQQGLTPSRVEQAIATDTVITLARATDTDTDAIFQLAARWNIHHRTAQRCQPS